MKHNMNVPNAVNYAATLTIQHSQTLLIPNTTTAFNGTPITIACRKETSPWCPTVLTSD